MIARVEGMPIHAFRFGPIDRTRPAFFVLGGVHGLERIGADLAIAYLESIIDRDLTERVIVVPMLNPVGVARATRANGNGVDLMRNAPPSPFGGTPILGGQQLSRHLPYFMGTSLQAEAKALIDLVEHELFETPYAIALDLHSGYGFIDRIWYPYARSCEPFPDLAAIDALRPHLAAYTVEQTAQAYTIRGDLWDYLYDRRRAHGPGRLIPLTLEMGSWRWVRERPLQGLTALGRFNPLDPQRHREVIAQHLPMIDALRAHATNRS